MLALPLADCLARGGRGGGGGPRRRIWWRGESWRGFGGGGFSGGGMSRGPSGFGGGGGFVVRVASAAAGRRGRLGWSGRSPRRRRWFRRRRAGGRWTRPRRCWRIRWRGCRWIRGRVPVDSVARGPVDSAGAGGLDRGGAGGIGGAGGLDRGGAGGFGGAGAGGFGGAAPNRSQLNSFLGLPSDGGMQHLGSTNVNNVNRNTNVNADRSGNAGDNFDVNRGAAEGPRGGVAAGGSVTGPGGNTAYRGAAVGPDGGAVAGRGVDGAGGGSAGKRPQSVQVDEWPPGAQSADPTEERRLAVSPLVQGVQQVGTLVSRPRDVTRQQLQFDPTTTTGAFTVAIGMHDIPAHGSPQAGLPMRSGILALGIPPLPTSATLTRHRSTTTTAATSRTRTTAST